MIYKMFSQFRSFSLRRYQKNKFLIADCAANLLSSKIMEIAQFRDEFMSESQNIEVKCGNNTATLQVWQQRKSYTITF